MANTALIGDNISTSTLTTVDQDFVKCQSKLVAVQSLRTSSNVSHGNGLHSQPNMSPAAKSQFFKISGKPVIISGDVSNCGHSIVGTGFVNIS